jgi:hypothetical protein
VVDAALGGRERVEQAIGVHGVQELEEVDRLGRVERRLGGGRLTPVVVVHDVLVDPGQPGLEEPPVHLERERLLGDPGVLELLGRPPRTSAMVSGGSLGSRPAFWKCTLLKYSIGVDTFM